MLAAIWADVLGLEEVGVDEDFFELGGHSLLATQVIARIRNAAKIQLPLHSLFTSPTVSGLAVVVDDAIAAASHDDSDDLATMLDELEGLSDEEAERLLALEASQEDK
jgi:acyl carrier protein